MEMTLRARRDTVRCRPPADHSARRIAARRDHSLHIDPAASVEFRAQLYSRTKPAHPARSSDRDSRDRTRSLRCWPDGLPLCLLLDRCCARAYSISKGKDTLCECFASLFHFCRKVFSSRLLVYFSKFDFRR